MEGPVGKQTAPPTRWKPTARAAALCTAMLLIGPVAGVPLCAAMDDRSVQEVSGGDRATRERQLEVQLGIPVFPGSSLIAITAPANELVNLERPGWAFVPAEVVVADFLVDAPIAELRRFYRDLCIRDPKLLLVRKDRAADEIISVRHSGRHPLHPRKRWLRIVTYRMKDSSTPGDSAPTIHRDGE